MRPGRCTGKAHRREYLGYARRRVLASRKWSGKTLADRKAWLMTTLGLSATDPTSYAWEPVTSGDPDHATRATTPARRRRPTEMALRARPGQGQSQRPVGSGLSATGRAA
jgi:hypothetical protein